MIDTKNPWIRTLILKLADEGLTLDRPMLLAHIANNRWYHVELRDDGQFVCSAVLVDFDGDGYALHLETEGITHDETARAAKDRAAHHAPRLPLADQARA